MAIHHDAIEAFILLLADPRVDPPVYGSRVLIEAIARDRGEMVELLLQDARVTADLSVCQKKLVEFLVRNQKEALLERLLDSKLIDPGSFAHDSGREASHS